MSDDIRRIGPGYEKIRIGNSGCCTRSGHTNECATSFPENRASIGPGDSRGIFFGMGCVTPQGTLPVRVHSR